MMTLRRSPSAQRPSGMRTSRLIMVLLVLFAVACSKDKDGGDKGIGAKSGGIPTSREGQMYLLGQKLSQAAMVNGRADAGLVARTFQAAGTVADITLQTKLAP